MARPLKIPKDILPYVEELEAKLKLYESSPYLDSYLTVYNQLKSFNEQLIIGSEVTSVNEEGIRITEKKGYVDLFAVSTDKSFDRTKWYFENILDLNKTLDALRKLMTPEEVKESGERKMNAQSTAERHIFKD